MQPLSQAGTSVAVRPFMDTGHLNEQTVSEASSLNVSELASAVGMSEREINELVEYESLSPLEGPQDSERFSTEWVAPLRAAAQLQRDLDLELFVTALLLKYLRRIDVLERELRALGIRGP